MDFLNFPAGVADADHVIDDPATDFSPAAYRPTASSPTAGSPGAPALTAASSSSEYWFILYAVIVPVLFATISLVGLVGNLLVIYVILSNARMRTVINLLLLNLAVADLCFVIVVPPFTAHEYIGKVYPSINHGYLQRRTHAAHSRPGSVHPSTGYTAAQRVAYETFLQDDALVSESPIRPFPENVSAPGRYGRGLNRRLGKDYSELMENGDGGQGIETEGQLRVNQGQLGDTKDQLSKIEYYWSRTKGQWSAAEGQWNDDQSELRMRHMRIRNRRGSSEKRKKLESRSIKSTRQIDDLSQYSDVTAAKQTMVTMSHYWSPASSDVVGAKQINLTSTAASKRSASIAQEQSPGGSVAACKLIHYIVNVTAYCTVYTLVMIACVRYMTVVHSVRTLRVRTRRNVLIAIAVLWTATLLLNAPIISVYSFQPNSAHQSQSECDVTTQVGRRLFVSFFLLAYLLPLLVIAALSAAILKHLSRHRAGVCDHETPLPQKNTAADANGLPSDRSSPGRTRNCFPCRRGAPVGPTRTNGRSPVSRTAEMKRQASRLIVLVVIMFAISWLPINIHLLISFYVDPSTQLVLYNNDVYLTYVVVCNCLAYINSCINPFIYSHVSKDFRDAFRDAVGCRRRDEWADQPDHVPLTSRPLRGDDQGRVGGGAEITAHMNVSPAVMPRCVNDDDGGRQAPRSQACRDDVGEDRGEEEKEKLLEEDLCEDVAGGRVNGEVTDYDIPTADSRISNLTNGDVTADGRVCGDVATYRKTSGVSCYELEQKLEDIRVDIDLSLSS